MQTALKEEDRIGKPGIMVGLTAKAAAARAMIPTNVVFLTHV